MKPINLLILLVRFSTILVTVDKKFCIIRFGIFPFMHRSLYLFLSRTLIVNFTEFSCPTPDTWEEEKKASEGAFAPYIDGEIVIKLFQLANKSLLVISLWNVHIGPTLYYLSPSDKRVVFWQNMTCQRTFCLSLSLSLLNRWALKTSLYVCHYCGCYITCLYSEHRFLQL
jgi:hypothetical protein